MLCVLLLLRLHNNFKSILRINPEYKHGDKVAAPLLDFRAGHILQRAHWEKDIHIVTRHAIIISVSFLKFMKLALKRFFNQYLCIMKMPFRKIFKNEKRKLRIIYIEKSTTSKYICFFFARLVRTVFTSFCVALPYFILPLLIMALNWTQVRCAAIRVLDPQSSFINRIT